MDCPNFFTILCCCKEKKTFAFYCFNFSSLTLSPNPHLSPHYSRSFKNIRMRAVHKWRHRLREKVGRTMIPNLGVRGAAKMDLITIEQWFLVGGALYQWFSTFFSRQPTKKKKIQLDDLVLQKRRPKVSWCKKSRRYLLRTTVLDYCISHGRRVCHFF